MQGKAMSLFHVQDNVRGRRISRQQFLWKVSTCLWYHITGNSYLHGHCCDGHKSHIRPWSSCILCLFIISCQPPSHHFV